MKKILLQFSLGLISTTAFAQLVVADFETYSLSPNSFYKDVNSVPFVSNNASFQYRWDTAFSFWSGGFSYTNKYDSINGSFTNLYGVIPYKGYNNSDTYVVGQNKGMITLAAVQNTVDGFYMTNTTYAYKAMLHGDLFARKFGDTTGTGSGTTIPQGSYPDYFKITVKGYDNGVMKQDSVQFYLADFRFSNNNLDYIVNTWQWVNTSALGEVDSIRFFMYSSDVGNFGINTPLFFGLDNFTTNGLILGLAETPLPLELQTYPNPFQSEIYLRLHANDGMAQLKIYDAMGALVLETEWGVDQMQLDLSSLQSGMYLLEVKQNGRSITQHLIKN